LIVGLGVELVDTARFGRAAARFGGRLERRLFTRGELAYAARRGAAGAAESLAARFAAKLAARRALGLRALAWHDVEVARGAEGPPELRLHGAAALRAAALGVRRAALSLSHDGSSCIGHVVLENGES
jgi:holo-[acyl-carrier protein] synthase